MRLSLAFGLVFTLASSSGGCTSRTAAPQAAASSAASAPSEGTAPQGDGGAPTVAEPAAKSAPTESTTDVAAYLRSRLPPGGSLDTTGGSPRIFHTVAAGDLYPTIAQAYLDLTEIYTRGDLAAAIEKKAAPTGGLIVGRRVEIPSPLTRVPRDPKEERLGLPEDRALRGIFLTGGYAQLKWVETLDKVAARGLNAVVLDAKDYMGPVNYPTKAKIAVEIGAADKAPIPDLARMIRFAHWRGIRVILRLPCFHDPLADKKAKDGRLSLRYSTIDQPMHIDWIDPTNQEAQEYAVEIAQEGVDAGADEIQLDYVRFPVHIGQKIAKLPDPKDRSVIIRDFIRRVHAVTKPAGASLSLDLFGVAATGERSDIDRLGQDIAVVGPEAEAISPMVYPSHYSKGYNGWDEPGDHPEIVGIGTKAAVKQLQAVGAKTVVRSWIQAFAWHTNIFGAKYVVDQAQAAEKNGGGGWLMWSPSCEYWPVWTGFPPLDANASAKKSAP